MAYEHKEGSAALFKNRDKTTDKHPDYKGDGMLDGQKVRLAAWIKESNGGKFLSLKIERENGDWKKDKPNAEPQGINHGGEDGGIPF